LAGTCVSIDELRTTGPTITASAPLRPWLSPEHITLLNAIWSKPARLLRQGTNHNGATAANGVFELARGPLEEMMKLAAQTDEADAPLLLIDCRAAGELLTWPEIRAGLAEPTFPVEI